MRSRGRSLIDRFSRVHPVTSLIFWMPLVVWLLYRSIDADPVSPWGMALVAVGALLAWTFTVMGTMVERGGQPRRLTVKG
jgi:hypothetical protein